MGLISIDLAFQAPEESCSREAIGDELIWNAALIKWVDHIRGDRSIPCPQVVRDCAEISLGLRFTDDAAIAVVIVHGERAAAALAPWLDLHVTRHVSIGVLTRVAPLGSWGSQLSNGARHDVAG